MTPRTLYPATAFVWTCAITTAALIVANVPLIKGVMWWVFGSGVAP